MRMLFLLLAGFIISSSAVHSQNQTQFNSLKHDVHFLDQNIFKDFQNRNNSGLRADASFDLFYYGADAVYADAMGYDFGFLFWELNEAFSVSPSDTTDNYTIKWAIVKYDELYDYETEITYPLNSSTVTLDSVYLLMNHQNVSGDTNTVIISILEIAQTPNGLMTPDQGITITNPVFHSDTFHVTESLTPGVPPTSAAFIGIGINDGNGIQLPQGAGFLVKIDYMGPKEDEFKLADGNRFECTDELASESIFPGNSLRYLNLLFPGGNNFTGVAPIPPLGGFPPNCNRFYFQNWGIIAVVDLDLDFDAVVSADKTTVCPGEFVSLNATIFGGEEPYTYEWSGPNIVSDVTQPAITVDPDVTSTYTVVVSEGGGLTDTLEITIEVAGIGVTISAAGGSFEIACGSTVNLLASTSGNAQGATYQWRKDGAIQTDVQSQQYPSAGHGEYRVTVTNNAGCQANHTVVVDDGVELELDFEWAPTTVIVNEQVTFTNTSNEEAGWNWHWEFGTGSGNISNQFSPTHTFDSEGTQVVTVTATQVGNSDCTRTLSQSINVQPVSFIANVKEHGVLINAYPNPSNGNVELQLAEFDSKDVKVSIYAVDGRIVYQETFKNVNDLNTMLNLTNVANGVYTITVETNENSFNSRLMIVK